MKSVFDEERLRCFARDVYKVIADSRKNYPNHSFSANLEREGEVTVNISCADSGLEIDVTLYQGDHEDDHALEVADGVIATTGVAS